MYDDVAVTKQPGFTAIKQHEMYNKWRHIFPRKYWDSTYPKPPKTLLLSTKKQTNRKANKAFAAKSDKHESEQEAEMLQYTDEVFGDMYEPVQVFGTDSFDGVDLDYFNVDGLDLDYFNIDGLDVEDLNVDNFVCFES